MSRYEQKVDNKYLPIILVLVVIVLIGLGVWYFQKNEDDNSVISQSVDIPKEKIETGSDEEKIFTKGDSNGDVAPSIENKISDDDLVPTPAKQGKLLELENSDDSFRQAVTEVSADLEKWFVTKDTIKKYIVLINDISQNQMLWKNRRFLKISQENMVQEDQQGLYLTKAGYRRYDGFAKAIASIDPKKGLDLYLTFKPLFNKVYKSFSYPGGYEVEDIFLKAAANVIKAPIVEARVGVVKHSLIYKFSDERLEALSDIEKQMLRMGPENTKKIQSKLRQLVELISGLDE